MPIHPTSRAIIATLLLSVASIVQTPAQNPPPAPPCPNQNQSQAQPPAQSAAPDQTAKPCTPTSPAKKSAAEQFPFPGQQSAPPAKPDTAPAAPTPNTTPGTTPSDAAAQHPFPTQPPPKLPGDDSSSSSSSADDPDNPPAAPPDANGNPPEGTSVHRKLPKPQHIQSDDERVDEDLNVARFYLRDENYQGAYLRTKDAVKIQPEYSAAHFALAEVAQKMKKNDEAVAEYQLYLKLDPDGEKAKAAKKALAELNGLNK